MVLFNELKFLTPDNVQGIYDRLFTAWVRINSDEYAKGIEKSPISQRAVRIYKIVWPFSTLPLSDSDNTCQGVPLTENMFIKEQIKHYQPIYDKTEGSQENRKQNYLIGLWLDYLKTKQKGLDFLNQKPILHWVNSLALYCALSELPGLRLDVLEPEDIAALYKEFGLNDNVDRTKKDAYKGVKDEYSKLKQLKGLVNKKDWYKYYADVIDVAKYRKDEQVLQKAEEAKLEYDQQREVVKQDDLESRLAEKRAKL